MTGFDGGSFIGRDQELLELERLVLEYRLLTLIGAGGTGKSRLARELVQRVARRFSAGAYFVELAPIREPELVPAAIARSLGLEEGGARVVSEMVLSYLRERELLLVLDNCEHVIDAAGFVREALRAGASLHVVATSRVPLGLANEHIYSVAPLQVPDDASALFVDRAAANGAQLDLGPEVQRTIARIAASLQGVPLAIELAAAQTGAFPAAPAPLDPRQRLAELAAALGQQPRDRDVVKRAMRLTYDALQPNQQAVVRRLSVCAGGCTREAAEYICELPLDLYALVATGLVRLDNGAAASSSRLVMLEPIRALALEELRARGELEQARARHAAYYLVLAEHAGQLLAGPDQAVWFDALDRDRDNLRVALQSLRERREPELMARMATNLAWFWDVRGYLGEGQQWLEQTLELAAALPVPAALHSRCLRAASQLAWRRGNYEATRRLAERSHALALQAADALAVAEIQQVLGNVAVVTGSVPEALALLNSSITAFRLFGDRPKLARFLFNLGVAHLVAGNTDQARHIFAEGEQISRDVGNLWSLGLTLGCHALLHALAGDWSPAREMIREGLPLMSRIGFRWGIAHGIVFAGLFCAAHAAHAQSARLIGAADSALEEIGATLWPPLRGLYADQVQVTRGALGDVEYAACTRAGRTLSIGAAVELAVQELPLVRVAAH
jgi:predicted ATPase